MALIVSPPGFYLADRAVTWPSDREDVDDTPQDVDHHRIITRGTAAERVVEQLLHPGHRLVVLFGMAHARSPFGSMCGADGAIRAVAILKPTRDPADQFKKCAWCIAAATGAAAGMSPLTDLRHEHEPYRSPPPSHRLALLCAALVLAVTSLSAFLRLAKVGLGCSDWPACLRPGPAPRAAGPAALGQAQAAAGWRAAGAPHHRRRRCCW